MRLLRRNVLLMYGVYAVTLVSGLVITPVIVSELGTEQYGIWALIGALPTLIGLLDVGLAPSIIRFAAEQRGRGAPDEVHELAAAGLVAYVAIALVTGVLAGGLAWMLPHVIEISDEHVAAARAALVIVVLAWAARFPLSLFAGLLAAQQRYDVINLASLLSAILYAVAAAVALLVFDGGLVALAVITAAVTLFRFVFPLAWLRRELPALRLRGTRPTRTRIAELFRFSSHNFLIQESSKVAFSADVIVVGVVLGGFAAGLYGIGAKLFALVFSIGAAATTLLFPVLAELEGSEDLERQREYALSGLRISLAVVLFAAVPLAVVADGFLEAWLPHDEDFSRSVPVLVLLMASIVFSQPTHLLSQFLVARGRHARLGVARLITVTCNLALSVGLAIVVGIWGVAAATLVTEIAFAAVVLPWLLRREAGVHAAALARAWLRPVLLAGIAALPTLALIGRGLGVDTLYELALVGVLWVAAYSALLWRFGLAYGERAAIGAALGRGTARAGAVAPVEEPG